MESVEAPWFFLLLLLLLLFFSINLSPMGLSFQSILSPSPLSGQSGFLSSLKLPQLLFCCPLGGSEELSVSGGKDQNGNLLSPGQNVFVCFVVCLFVCLNLLPHTPCPLSLCLSLFCYINLVYLRPWPEHLSHSYHTYTSWDCPLSEL